MTKRGTWQKAERDVAKALHGERNRLSGSVDQLTSGDVVHPELYVEVKYRQTFQTITLLKGVQLKAKEEGKVPVLVLIEAGNATRYYVVSEDTLLRVAEALIDDEAGDETDV